MRGGELPALLLYDIEAKPGGILVTIRHSKTDQESRGQVVAVAHGCCAATDPVAALASWLKIRCDQPGALFTRIWASRISDQALGNHVVARTLRQRAIAAGLDDTRITAHMRTLMPAMLEGRTPMGLATLRGQSCAAVPQHAGTKSYSTVKQAKTAPSFVRPGGPWTTDPGRRSVGDARLIHLWR